MAAMRHLGYFEGVFGLIINETGRPQTWMRSASAGVSGDSPTFGYCLKGHVEVDGYTWVKEPALDCRQFCQENRSERRHARIRARWGMCILLLFCFKSAYMRVCICGYPEPVPRFDNQRPAGH